MLAAGGRGGESGACRQAYGTEWARLMVLLQGMQGLGKPGVNIWGTTMGPPIQLQIRFSPAQLLRAELPERTAKKPDG
jgi:trimethylamine-N-oxide reductase (cytochrome c)